MTIKFTADNTIYLTVYRPKTKANCAIVASAPTLWHFLQLNMRTMSYLLCIYCCMVIQNCIVFVSSCGRETSIQDGRKAKRAARSRENDRCVHEFLLAEWSLQFATRADATGKCPTVCEGSRGWSADRKSRDLEEATSALRGAAASWRHYPVGLVTWGSVTHDRKTVKKKTKTKKERKILCCYVTNTLNKKKATEPLTKWWQTHFLKTEKNWRYLKIHRNPEVSIQETELHCYIIQWYNPELNLNLQGLCRVITDRFYYPIKVDLLEKSRKGTSLHVLLTSSTSGKTNALHHFLHHNCTVLTAQWCWASLVPLFQNSLIFKQCKQLLTTRLVVNWVCSSGSSCSGAICPGVQLWVESSQSFSFSLECSVLLGGRSLCRV